MSNRLTKLPKKEKDLLNKILQKEQDEEKMTCPSCKSLLEQRQHKFLTDILLNQQFIYAKWYVCPNCKDTYTYKHDIIYNLTSGYIEDRKRRDNLKKQVAKDIKEIQNINK